MFEMAKLSMDSERYFRYSPGGNHYTPSNPESARVGRPTDLADTIHLSSTTIQLGIQRHGHSLSPESGVLRSVRNGFGDFWLRQKYRDRIRPVCTM